MKSIYAFACSLLVWLVVTLVAHILSYMLFPPASGVVPSTAAELQTWFADLPYAAFLLVLAGYAVGGLALGFTVTRLSSRPMRIAIFAAGTATLAVATKALVVGEPFWMFAATLVLILPFTLLATGKAKD